MNPIINRNIATASAGGLVLSQAEKVVNDHGSHSSALVAAILPLFGLRWGREVCERVGGNG